jgi:hypothetical protein
MSKAFASIKRGLEQAILHRRGKRMTRVTLTLDEYMAAWARMQAAEQGVSLSRFIEVLLRERLRPSHEYEEAYRAWRAEKPFDLKGPWKPYPKREELYDRPVLRRR